MNVSAGPIGQEQSASKTYYAVVDTATLGERYVGCVERIATIRSVPGTAFGVASDGYDAIDAARKVAMQWRADLDRLQRAKFRDASGTTPDATEPVEPS